jgi:hypothetical protein
MVTCAPLAAILTNAPRVDGLVGPVEPQLSAGILTWKLILFAGHG